MTAAASVHHPIFPPYAPTMPAAMAQAARQFGERDFLVTDRRSWSHAEVEEESAQLALGLLAAGVGKGTRVAILMPNSPEWVICWFAAARIGALTLPISTFFAEEELAWILREADVHTLLVCNAYLNHDYCARLERALPGLASCTSTALALPRHPYLRQIAVWGDGDRAWAIRGAPALRSLAAPNVALDRAFLSRAEEQVTPADLLVGICTSGTTARPKIVVHTHGSAVRNTYCYRPFVGIRPGERSYTASAFFWVAGLNGNLLPTLYEGASLVFASTPAPDDVLDAIARHGVTRLNMWQPQLVALHARARERGIDIAGLQGVASPCDAHGVPIPPSQRIASMMGMTETFGPHSMDPYDRALPAAQGGSWGHGLEGVDRRIVNPETRAPLPTGAEGELLVRGFSLMHGYYKRERCEVFDADGYFASGDLARIDDDGCIFFTGRSSELIKTSGANVAPREVEAALQGAPGVREAIVFGLPDVLRGERVVAVIVAHEGMAPDAVSLRAWLQTRLSAYKIPRSVHVLAASDIPRTGSNKARKAALKALLLAQTPNSSFLSA